MLWSWYMATDMQFFVLSALLLLLAKKWVFCFSSILRFISVNFGRFFLRHFKFSATTILIIMVSAWCTTAFISYTNQYEARVQEPFALFDELYDKPWTRIGPYIVGMCSGWLLYRTNCKISMSIVSFHFIFFIYLLYFLDNNKKEVSFYREQHLVHLRQLRRLLPNCFKRCQVCFFKNYFLIMNYPDLMRVMSGQKFVVSKIKRANWIAEVCCNIFIS